MTPLLLRATRIDVYRREDGMLLGYIEAYEGGWRGYSHRTHQTLAKRATRSQAAARVHSEWGSTEKAVAAISSVLRGAAK